MNKSVVFGFLGVAAFLIAGWLGFSLYDGDRAGARNTSASGQTLSRPNKVAVKTNDVGKVETPNTNSDITPAESLNDSESTALRLLTWRTDTNDASPKACFSFSGEFNQSQRVALGDYFTSAPETALTLSVNGAELCLSGFPYDGDVSVTWKEGLSAQGSTIQGSTIQGSTIQGSKAQDGKVLASDTTRIVGFGDKPAYVGFVGNGVILPRINAQGLAIETVNVDTLQVEIANVSDRMMARRDVISGEQTLEGDYSWEYQDAATEVRTVIWSGTVAVKSVANETVTTVLPFSELVGTLKPGAYIVTAEREHEDDEHQIARAWRWIISTDLAISSYRSADALDVAVRSIDSASLLPRTKLVLVAHNNEILSETVTGSDGRARFNAAVMRGKGPLRPKMVMAYGKSGDYAALDLSRSPIDISAFNIGGRAVSGAVDVFSYTERGIYRPGETVHFTALLRNAEGVAVNDRPITIEIQRPNGLIMSETRIAVGDIAVQAGAIVHDYTVPTSAARGMWRFVIKADGLGVIDSQNFSVQDFVPQRLKVEIKTADTPMTDQEIREVVIDSQFLYGAPGAGLTGEAEARLRIDPTPFKGYSDYSFGLKEVSFRERLIDMGGGTTDAKGLLPLELDLKNNDIDSSHPLRAEITAGVSEPGGRYTKNSTRISVRTQDRYIGIKSSSGMNRVSKGKPITLELIALSAVGERRASSAQWQLINEDWDYQWYREGSRWRYRRDVIDTVIKRGEIAISKDTVASWSDGLDWGTYRLQLTDENGDMASYRFSVGWGTSETSNRPDQIQIGGPTEAVMAGETFTLDINAPYAGEAELVIANDKVRMVKSLTLAEGGATVSLKFDPKWGDSVYALLTLYTPRDIDARPVPRRAVGISYIERDRSANTLSVEIGAKALIRPRQNYTVELDVTNIPRGEQAYVTLAAVDEGILRLTKYKSPEAAKTLFGKKALAIDIFDDYARLLNANLGAPAIANSGGDSLGGEGLTVVPTRTVALFSGPVTLTRGKAKISFDIPPFNGELRIMATAWSKTAVGSASQSMTVRDRVPALIGLPRFLAPGDVAQATVSLDNVEGAAGLYKAALTSSGVIASNEAVALELPKGVRKEDVLVITAGKTGVDKILLNVSGPGISGSGRYKTSTDYPISVRTPYRPITRGKLVTLKPGQSLSLSPSDMPFKAVPGSVDVTVSFSSMAGLTPMPYITALSQYPYGCTEQTVSTALPLLYSDKLGGVNTAPKLAVQKAIDRLINRQDHSGAFGLWAEGDGKARAWLGVQTTFFLQEADGKDYIVPKESLKKAYRAIKEISTMPRYPNVNYRFSPNIYEDKEVDRMAERAESAAFAHYVLARAGKGDLSAMRYHYDHHSSAMRTALSHAYIGAALQMMGDKRRAKQAFETAMKAANYDNSRDYYQSKLRDIAGLFALATEVDMETIKTKALPMFAQQLDKPERLNTQELGYSILAFNAFAQTAKPVSVTSKNVSMDSKNSTHFYGKDLADNPVFKNTGEGTVYASLGYSGAPMRAPEPMANGFELDKSIFTMKGKRIDAQTLKQGERVIIRISFNSTSRASRMAVIADLLPAGLEIETLLGKYDGEARRSHEEDGLYPFLGKLSDFTLMEARDDRFVASRETYRTDEYSAAYIARAVTPGQFTFPGAVVEDMYRAEDRALTKTTRLTVSADNAL